MTEFKPGLEGVVAFETEIAEPDREGGSLRYRGVDIEELVGRYRFEQVWGLLVDESFEPGLPAVDPYEGGGLTGNTPADLQSVTARVGAEWGLQKLIDITDDEAREDLRRVSAQFISIAAQSARLADGNDDRIAPQVIAQGKTTAERFLLEWRGEADPKHVQAIDTYWICTCEHGLNASTFVARITASTGADCAAALSSAVGALSGPLHGGAPSRALDMLDQIGTPDRAEAWLRAAVERGDRLMGFGHRVYKTDDPRSLMLREVADQLGGDKMELARHIEATAIRVLDELKPGRKLYTNVEFYAGIVMDRAGIPPELFTPTFAASRTVGWCAHILEQAAHNRLIRPSAQYVGPPPPQPVPPIPE
jgi:citrate synthase